MQLNQEQASTLYKMQENHKRQVQRLGAEIGYGNMMDLASQCWREYLVGMGAPPGGEFVVGPCACMVVPCGCELPHKCEWCNGCGWLSKHVKAIKDRT